MFCALNAEKGVNMNMDKKEVTEKILTVSHNEKVDELTDEQLARISEKISLL